jgi:RNA polymerase sigma-70 factor, ECF subfamily
MHQSPPDDPSSKPSGSTMTLAEVVARACEGDREAFARLYMRYKKPLGKRLMALVNDQETAYDLYQETFIRIWENRRKLRRIPFTTIVERFEPWLYRIARNLAVDYLRHSRKFTFLSYEEDISDEGIFEPPTPGLAKYLGIPGHEDQVCDLLCLKEALAKMSPKYRTCLLLQVHWGYSQQEIAKVLEISAEAVSTNVSRGYRQLRTIYMNMMSDHSNDDERRA